MALCKGEIVGDEVNEKIYIAVGKQWKACKSSVEWTIRNSKGKKLCLVHVHQPAQYISICWCLDSFCCLSTLSFYAETTISRLPLSVIII